MTVTDAAGGTASDTFTVTVNAVNDLPTIGDVADQTVAEDNATAALGFTVGDVETAAADLTVSGTSSNASLVPDGNIAIGGTGLDRTVTVTPAANQFGTATITVAVTDADGGAASDSFVLTVGALNDSPTISDIADQTVVEGAAPDAVGFTIGDLETASGDLAVSGASSNTALVDGEEGLFKAQSWDYDCIVLDLMLPRLNGWQLLERLRKTKKIAVLILTARDGVGDRVRGLDSGADDYLTKPFDLAELLARVRALIRRAAGQASPVLKVGAVAVDTRSRTVTRARRPVPLTPREYALLELLLLRRGGDSLSNLVEVHVSNIRKQLGKEIIVTRPAPSA